MGLESLIWICSARSYDCVGFGMLGMNLIGLWFGTEPPVNDIDWQLFRASTIVTVGNGLKAEFWNSVWLNGVAPRDLVLNLYKLAWRKHKKVFEEVTNANWTRGLRRMSSVVEMAEFVELWDRVQGF